MAMNLIGKLNVDNFKIVARNKHLSAKATSL